MTVRKLIWFWQIVEGTLIFWLFNRTGLPVLVSLVGMLGTMVALRFAIIGFICGLTTLFTRQEPLSIRQFFQYWWGEFFAFIRLYFYDQAKPRPKPAGKGDVGTRHVILVHGFFCNDGFWFRLAPLLQANGYTVSTVEMPSAFASVDYFSTLVQAEITRVFQQCPDVKPTIIAFSMGGLAARTLTTTAQSKVNLITLYTPHLGSYLAAITGLFGAPNGRQMTPGSGWLRNLNSAEPSFQRSFGFWTTHDTIVMPAKNSIPPFKGLKRHGHGHLNASVDRTLHRHILRILRCFYDGQSTVMRVSSSNASNSLLKHSMIDSGV